MADDGEIWLNIHHAFDRQAKPLVIAFLGFYKVGIFKELIDNSCDCEIGSFEHDRAYLVDSFGLAIYKQKIDDADGCIINADSVYPGSFVARARCLLHQDPSFAVLH